MTAAAVNYGSLDARAEPAGLSRLYRRELAHYPGNGVRFTSLGIVVLTTVILYYQLYLAGGVATAILTNLHMSFVYYVNVSVIGYILGAVAAVVAGLADRYGRANIVTAGLALTGILCAFVLPNVHSKAGFGITYIAIGFVEGIVLVATPALVRDFSPQLGRASAMGFWTLGPVLGSLVVSAVVSNSASTTTWQHQYVICGVIGLVVFLIALVGLRELSPRLRDQLMVSSKDRELIEAKARGIDLEAATGKKPFSQMMHVDILGSAFAISVFLIIYYIAVGFFPVFFETVFGYSQSKANALGNYFWACDAAALLIIGYISDKVRVRKPFMVAGAIGAAVSTVIFATRATHPTTSYSTFVVLLILISCFLGMAFAPWMASFTETVERRNPALIATGLAVWGLIIRLVIAISVFFVPHVVNTVTTLVQDGPVVQGILANPTPIDGTTYGKAASAAAANPTVIAKLTDISTRDGVLIKALQANPAVATALAQGAAAGVTPTNAQLGQIEAAIGAPAFAILVKPGTTADLAYLSSTAPKALGAANFAALTAPTPAFAAQLATLNTLAPGVVKASADSPKQWRTYFLIGAGGELVFIPLILLMAGYWSPRKAREAEEAHAVAVQREMASMGAA